MAINWGSAFGSGNYIGRLGIDTVVSSQTDTQITFVNYVYYWTKYAVTDNSNNFYVDWDSYADTSIWAKSISHPSNSAWSESNKTYIGAWTATFNKTTSAQTKYFSARCSIEKPLLYASTIFSFLSCNSPLYPDTSPQRRCWFSFAGI